MATKEFDAIAVPYTIGDTERLMRPTAGKALAISRRGRGLYQVHNVIAQGDLDMIAFILHVGLDGDPDDFDADGMATKIIEQPSGFLMAARAARDFLLVLETWPRELPKDDDDAGEAGQEAAESGES